MDSNQRYAGWLHRGNLHGVWGAIMGVWMLPAGVAASGRHVPVPFLLLIPLGALVGFTVGKLIGTALLSGSGAAAQRIYMPNAAGTYAQTHSQIDALEAKGDYRGAVDSWEAVAVSQPANPWPLIRAGELYQRQLAEPAMALDRFQLARGIPGITPELERYASQKIIDLHLGPLDDPGRALVELRRLIDRHPGTREADGARTALASIKARRGDG